MCAVINAYRAALRSTLLQEIDANAVAAADNLGGVYAKVAQAVYSCLTDCMLRQLGDKRYIHAVVCQRYSDICFTAAEGCLHLIILKKTIISVWSKAKHQFTESYYLSHYARASFTISRDCLHRSVISSHFWLSISVADTM